MFTKQMIKNMPVKRLGEIEELANLAAYMCSDYSNFLNGEVNISSSILLGMVPGGELIAEVSKDWGTAMRRPILLPI